jgi:hypothetical protein
MPYKLLADLTAITHLAFVIFIILGGLFAFKWKRMAWVHIPAAVWGAMIEFYGWICPLTYMENYFREEAGIDTMSHGFVAHYIMPVLYPAELTKDLQIKLGIFVIVINLIIYSLVAYRHRRIKK